MATSAYTFTSVNFKTLDLILTGEYAIETRCASPHTRFMLA